MNKETLELHKKRSIFHGKDKFVEEILHETNCKKCIHNKVCNHQKERQCINFWLGTTTEKGCMACTHRFTRYDKVNKIPCFKCNDFKKQVS